MKNITLTRYFQNSEVTLGVLDVSSLGEEGKKVKPIYTLENPWKQNQENVSCIPEGRYQCEPFNGMKFKGVYHLIGVSERTNILIHCGNYEWDTNGCILVGRGVDTGLHTPVLLHSQAAMNYLRELIGTDKFLLKIESLK